MMSSCCGAGCTGEGPVCHIWLHVAVSLQVTTNIIALASLSPTMARKALARTGVLLIHSRVLYKHGGFHARLMKYTAPLTF